ncbi:hypothetical protein MNBD_BACTEROID06-166 [hydrothermal vent metagenome]|uniref:Uncharacterized protein n=1 Tax=hydrothermal vent metagenome TaxID=652676 RepID=A0A3B0UCR1_9ZZZZ
MGKLKLKHVIQNVKSFFRIWNEESQQSLHIAGLSFLTGINLNSNNLTSYIL